MHQGGDADRRLLAAKRLFEGDFEVVAQIAAAARTALAAAPAAHRAEHLLEGVGKAAALLEGGVPEAVIGGALLVVLQNVVGFVDVLEFLLGGLVPGVAVGVVLHRQLAIGPLQFLGVGGSADAENLVEIALGHVRRKPAGRTVLATPPPGRRPGVAGWIGPWHCRHDQAEPRFLCSSTSSNSASTTLSSPPGPPGWAWPLACGPGPGPAAALSCWAL